MGRSPVTRLAKGKSIRAISFFDQGQHSCTCLAKMVGILKQRHTLRCPGDNPPGFAGQPYCDASQKLQSPSPCTNCTGCPKNSSISKRFSKLGVILRRAFRLPSLPKARYKVSFWSRIIASMTNSQIMSTANEPPTPASTHPPSPARRRKLSGRAFYESLGSPKMILAPMVDQSEFVRYFIHLPYR